MLLRGCEAYQYNLAMLKPAKRMLCTALMAAVAASCTTTLELDHHFRLDGVNGDGALTFEDENFSFGFTPVPSGVFFVVKNQSTEAAYIEWQNCFFVEPGGNTFNALNTDILDESNEVAQRSAHRTQIPSRATVARFTTSTVNAKEGNLVTVSEVGTMLSQATLEQSPAHVGGTPDTATVRATASYAASLTATKVEFWNARRYWKSAVSGAMGGEKEALRNYANENLVGRDTMALGLRIAHNDVVHDYRFNFTIDAVFASSGVKSATSWDGHNSSERKIRYFALRNEDWAWRPMAEFGTPLTQLVGDAPTNEIGPVKSK